jgi:hypothetical protein
MPDLPASAPEAARSAEGARSGRDLLGTICFWLHVAIMVYIVTGWLVPVRAWLVFYVIFLPGIAVQWRFNKNSCVLNNIESLLRHGRWRDTRNFEEGAWLLTLVTNTLGLKVRALHMEVFTYAALGLLWVLGILHLRGF